MSRRLRPGGGNRGDHPETATPTAPTAEDWDLVGGRDEEIVAEVEADPPAEGRPEAYLPAKTRALATEIAGGATIAVAAERVGMGQRAAKAVARSEPFRRVLEQAFNRAGLDVDAMARRTRTLIEEPERLYRRKKDGSIQLSEIRENSATQQRALDSAFRALGAFDAEVPIPGSGTPSQLAFGDRVKPGALKAVLIAFAEFDGEAAGSELGAALGGVLGHVGEVVDLEPPETGAPPPQDLPPEDLADDEGWTGCGPGAGGIDQANLSFDAGGEPQPSRSLPDERDPAAGADQPGTGGASSD